MPPQTTPVLCVLTIAHPTAAHQAVILCRLHVATATATAIVLHKLRQTQHQRLAPSFALDASMLASLACREDPTTRG